MLALSDKSSPGTRGRLVTYVPQDPGSALNPALRIGKQILEVLNVHGYGANQAERDTVSPR